MRQPPSLSVSPRQRRIQGARQFGSILEIQRFDQERIRAKFVSTVDVAYFIRRGEHHHANMGQFPLTTDPEQDFKTIDCGHFDVKKHQPGYRMLATIVVRPITPQVSDCVGTGRHALNLVPNSGPLERPSNEQNVVLVIFDQENQGQ